MAQSVQIPGTQQNAKICNVVGVGALAFFFSIIYLWIFWYRVNKEMAVYGQSKGTDECGTSPGKSLLAVTLGALIIVPAIISFFRTHKRLVATQKLAGKDPISGWISLILYIVFSPAWLAYMQSGLNPVWEGLASGTADAPAAIESAAADQAPAADEAPAVDTDAATGDAPADGETQA
jgi:hypothetical protein